MTVETQKQKRIIHFVITTTIDQLSVDLTWLLKQKQKRIIHFVITTTIDHYLSI